MVVLGIDPGYAIVGYGLIDYQGINYRALGCGAVTTDADTPFEERLKIIFEIGAQVTFVFPYYNTSVLCC